jgi:hypothetical protein
MEAKGSKFTGLEIEKRFSVSHGPRPSNRKMSTFWRTGNVSRLKLEAR